MQKTASRILTAFTTVEPIMKSENGKISEIATSTDGFSTDLESPNTMVSSRRDQLAIILDILKLARQPIYKKRILQGANLNRAQLKKYVGYLVRKGLLKEEAGVHRLFVTTAMGIEFISMLMGSTVDSKQENYTFPARILGNTERAICCGTLSY